MKFYPKSRSTGTCRKCHSEIQKRQPAWWSTSGAWLCTKCRPAPSDQPGQSKPAQAKRSPKAKPASFKGATITRDGSRWQIEFERMADACQLGGTDGAGSLENVNFVDESVKANERTKFLNRRSVESVKHLLKTGSEKLTAMVEQMRESIAGDIPMPTATRRRLQRGRDCGDEIQVDRFLDRVPEMWERMEIERTPAKRATITINAAVGYSESQDNLGYRAAAAIALADALTERGVSVEIRLVFCVGNATDKVKEYITTVIVKQSDQPVSIADLAAACCDIGVIRLGLIYGSSRVLEGTIIRTLGTPIKIPADRQVGEFIADRDINSRYMATEWVRESLEKFETN